MPNGGQRAGSGRKKKITPELERLIGEQCEQRWLHLTRCDVADNLSARLSALAEQHRADLHDIPVQDGWRAKPGSLELVEEVGEVLNAELRDRDMTMTVRTPKVGRQQIIKAVAADYNTLWKTAGLAMIISPASVDRCWKAFRKLTK